jgi:UDP-glucuronate decarboxylase
MVTGCAGFIGSALCERLLKDGHQVWGVDNLLNNRTYRMSKCKSYETFRFMADSIQYVDDLELPRIDVIYNLASPTIPGEFKQYPIDTISANVSGLKAVLDLARYYGSKVVHASTIRVLEPVDLQSQNACYIEGKRCAEVLCHEYSKTGLDVSVVRLFSVYGPGMKKEDTRVVPVFIRKALFGEDLEIIGKGHQMDTFTYVDDVVDFFVSEANQSIGSLITFDCGDAISILGLAMLVKEITGSKSSIVRIGKVFEGINRVTMHQSNKTVVGLREGLEKTVEYYKKLI